MTLVIALQLQPQLVTLIGGRRKFKGQDGRHRCCYVNSEIHEASNTSISHHGAQCRVVVGRNKKRAHPALP
jgi:hypothetical protein